MADIEIKIAADFRRVRNRGVPIIAVETPDPAQTQKVMFDVLATTASAIAWDSVRGTRHLNTPGEAVLKTLWKDAGLPAQQALNNPVVLLDACRFAPPKTCVFIHNAQHQLKEPPFAQALLNLRDSFKKDNSTVILLGPALRMPPEIAGDVVSFDEPLPSPGQLKETFLKQHTNAKLDAPKDDVSARAVEALAGLPIFAAEQSTALSLTTKGIELDSLWERKRKAIEQTNGLRVYRGGAKFADLRGIDNVVAFMKMLVDANAFGAVVFLDEADKALAGGLSDYSGDSGVSKDQVGTLLSYMQDTDSIGVLLAGWAGTGKSELAKAVANEAGKVCIVLDLGGAKGGTVGQSEDQIRTLLKVITATANGRVLFIFTANKTTQFTPELNRRCADQFWFDPPDKNGRKAIWKVYIAKCGLTAEQTKIMPGDDGWTGAEIRRVCERAKLLNITVAAAAQYLVPSVVSGKKQLEEMRAHADGRFLSAHYPGWYHAPTAAIEVNEPTGGAREINLDD